MNNTRDRLSEGSLKDKMIHDLLEAGCENITSLDYVCEKAIKSNYRKEDEVIKETAKWIYKALLGTEHIKELEQKEHCDWWVSMWRLEDLNRVFKEFGVDVEEW